MEVQNGGPTWADCPGCEKNVYWVIERVIPPMARFIVFQVLLHK